jgi:hypothetical protein
MPRFLKTSSPNCLQFLAVTFAGLLNDDGDQLIIEPSSKKTQYHSKKNKTQSTSNLELRHVRGLSAGLLP